MSRLSGQISGAFFAIALLIFPVLANAAETDPNPDSPTPVLISQPDSTRALAVAADAWRGALPKSSTGGAFAYGADSRIKLFVTNVELMSGEGANAFRVYIQDFKNREYRLPVLDIRQVKGYPWIYALTVQMQDEIGFWEEQPATGDVLVRVSWRGLTSNRVRLGLGETGGKIRDDEGATPTPAPLSPPVGNSPSAEIVGYRWSGDRIRFLEQATFGPTQALDDRIRRIGLRTWLAEQFEAPYPSNPYPNIPLMPVNAPTDCQNNIPPNCIRDHYSMYPVQTWFYREAFYGEPQLKHRTAWALSQIWVISGVDTQQSSWMLTYHQMLSRNAFGNWRNLMLDMTLNPGMGNYLDMARSTRNSPNENYAREILQLFNVGLFMLNQDGTLQRDGQGNPIPTYDQNTVNNFTKVLTGWSFCEAATAQCPNRVLGSPNYKDPMIVSNANNHDITAKTLLNYPGANPNIPACTGCTGTATINYANNSLHQALDNIFYHPNVAPFVSKLLIQQMVTSDPTPAYVGRVAAVFNNNGSGIRGDMKAVIRAILLDPEARGNVKTEPRYGKLREPVQLLTNVLRQFNVRSADGMQLSDGNVNGLSNAMGQNAFNAPTVFNYYSPDYIVPGTTVLAPEFGIYTTGTSIARANFANTMIFNRINASQPNTPLGTSISLAEMQALAAADASGNQLMDALNQKMMHGAMSSQMRTTILNAVLAAPANNPLLRAQTAVYLIATSSQYQVQR
ncbi:MAG: DUF1800 domain-containing protein [Acidobacteriota bacterium]|nr:DUF1800 domain-containing protein [Acidobacteriota bacterium]